MPRLKRLVQRFKQHGYKMTPQRRAILEALTEDTSHPTAEQIHETVRKRMPDISLATVYNTLRELAEMQELCELDLGHGVRHYEISQEEHAHQVCLMCGRIEDIPGDFEKVKSLFVCGEGFHPVRYTVTIYGYCADYVSSPDTKD
jgi:Fur family peroxide stress response transcriptional regulator